MSVAHVSRPRSRVLVVMAAVLAVAAAGLIAPNRAAAAFQPVTVVTSVNGVAGAQANTGALTTVGFAVTNASTTGAKLGAFSIVVPPGLGTVTRAGVSAPGNWNETVLPCGGMARCSAIILATAGFPLSNSLVGPHGTVTASINFRAPSTPGTLSFPMIGVGNGIFTVSGPTASINVVNGAVARFTLVAPNPAKAGVSSAIAVTSVNSSGQTVPFAGGSVSVTLGTDDGNATVNGVSFANAHSLALNLPAASSGQFSLSSVFKTATPTQTLLLSMGAVVGTSNVFAVTSGTPASLQLTSITDTSNTPALPTPAANQTFAVAFAAYDAFGNPAAGVPVTLSAVPPLNGLLTAAPGVTGANGTGVITATYSAPQTGLQLQVSSPGPTAGTKTTDVVSSGDSSPGGSGDQHLAAGGATADLPNGSFGPVFLTTAPCNADDCGQGVEITLDGTFTQGDNHLYSFQSPAQMTWTCQVATCPYYPSDEEGSSRQYDDFIHYPIDVALKTSDGYGAFNTAPACADDSETTGVIENELAQIRGFCIDVNAITRAQSDGDWCPWPNGDLTIPVLFVEDPKMRPGP